MTHNSATVATDMFQQAPTLEWEDASNTLFEAESFGEIQKEGYARAERKWWCKETE